MVTNKGETKALWEVTLAIEGTPTDVWNAETETVNVGALARTRPSDGGGPCPAKEV